MHPAPSSRRVLGLAAAGALAFGFTALGSAGIAQASPAPSWSASGTGATAAVPTGICSVHWQLTGGSGGADSTGTAGGNGGALDVTTPVTAGDVFTLYPGTAGAAGTSAPAGGAHGTNGYTADPTTEGTAGGTDGTSVGYGGGGAASVVTKGGSLSLLAFGGDGAGAPGSGGGGGVDLAPDAEAAFDSSATATAAGNGSITGTGILCAPSTPYLNFVTAGDRQLAVNFTDPGDGDVPAVSYEYTTDGTTWQALTTTTADGRLTGTITGLTNGTTYSVQVRGVAASTGRSQPSNVQDGTPLKVAGAPGQVTATVGPASLTLHWTAATAGDFQIAGYQVMSMWNTGQSGGAEKICQTSSATALTCTGPAQAGKKHDLLVFAVDSQGNQGARAELTSDTVPFTADPPTASGGLTPASGTTATSVHPGTTMTVSGSGYTPFSSVTVLIYSSPQVLTTVVADAGGSFTVTVTVPDGLEAGHHTLVASGVDSSGALRYVTLPVTVVGGTTGSGGLAYTGVDVALPLTGGLIALAAGAALMVVARRRKVGDKAA